MKAYVATTAALFGLLVAAHAWRAVLEGPHVTGDPWWLGITGLAATLCGWGCVLLARARGRGGAPPAA
jgi:hypothetical protein